MNKTIAALRRENEELAIQIGYERGKYEMVTALYALMSEAAERGESSIKLTTLANVCARELRK